MSGRAALRNTSTGGSAIPSTIAELEEAFVRVHALWLRSPGGGRWPFAGDGPWHLAQAEVGDIKGDYSQTLLDTGSGREVMVRKVESRSPVTPLRSYEVDERDRMTAWIGLIGDVQLRKAVWLATEALAKGDHGPGARLPWTAIAAWVGWSRTPNALKAAYRRTLGEVVCALNGWPVRRARGLAGK